MIEQHNTSPTEKQKQKQKSRKQHSPTVEMSSSSESHLLKIGLKFGQKTYFEDVGVGEETKSESGLSPVSGGSNGGGPPKKGRTTGLQGGIQLPRCQVEGCNLDLSDAKTYYSRHKVCGVHSKTAKVIVNGLEQRFCQQCSRFHQLSEFDNGKRSCRRRLAGHNERRRKPTSGSLLAARYGTLPSSIFESNPSSGGFVMDFSACSRGRTIQWPTTRQPPTTRFTNDLLTATTDKFPPLPWQSNLDNPPPYLNPSFNGVQESNCVLSLLSNHHSASRNQTINHDYYVNPNSNPNPNPNPNHDPVGSGSDSQMVHHPSGSMVQGHFAPTGWGYDMNEAHLGLGQAPIPHPGYPGELGLGQQARRPFDPSTDHIDWSL